MIFAKDSSELEAKELPKWKKLKESGAKVELKRFIDGKEVVSKQELMNLWGKTAKTLERYVKDGMPKHELSTPRFQIFALQDCLDWRDGSIDKTMSIKTEKPESKNEDISGIEDLENKSDLSRKLKADADSAELKVKLEEIKLAEAEGRVVDADDLDKAMSEQAIIHRTDKTNDEKILPIILENKESSEIAEILHEHNQERLDGLDEIINREFESQESMFEIVEHVLSQLKKNIEPKELIERINKIA